MTDREKIIGIIDKWAKQAVITNINGASVYDQNNATELTNALIAAGAKFDINISYTAAFDLVQLERINDLGRRLAATDHRAEVAEKALDKACADMGQLMDCCRWAANGGVITIEEYTPEKITPQAYIDRAEKELAEESKNDKS